VLTVLNGKGEIVVDDDVRTIVSGDVVDIPAGRKHAIRAVTDLFLIEVQIGTSLAEDL
jgi:mannose-1-phosphate guanylyltransferase